MIKYDALKSVYNAYYDRPTVLSLLPRVQGKRSLDIGCGPGLYTAWLIEHGAPGDLVYFDEAFDPWNEGRALRESLATLK